MLAATFEARKEYFSKRSFPLDAAKRLANRSVDPDPRSTRIESLDAVGVAMVASGLGRVFRKVSQNEFR